jgi:hypothetical protein
MDRTVYKQQSFAQATEHQSAYDNASEEERTEHFNYLMSVAFGFVGQAWPKMDKQQFRVSRRT